MRSSAVGLHFLIMGYHECGVKTEAEMRVMLPQAKELLKAGMGSGTDLSLVLSGGTRPC